MSDIEVDSLPPGLPSGGSGILMERLSPMQYTASSPYTIPGGYTRDYYAFSGDNSRNVSQPSDSVSSNHRTTYKRTSASSQSVYTNSVNNVIQTNHQNSIMNHRNNTSVRDNNMSAPYNFSHMNSSDSASIQGLTVSSSDNISQPYNFSHDSSSIQSNQSSNNTAVSTNSRVPDISRLSLDNTDSSFVFNRPPPERNNMHNRPVELPNSKYPNYRTMAQRIQSYVYSIAPVRSPQDMSEAGFFAISNQDFVRCFHCGIGLRNWEEDDDPYVEHCRWSPHCQYMKMKKGQAFIDAVQEAVRKVQLEEALGESETRDGARSPGPVSYQDLAEDGENGESYPLHVLKKNPLLTNAAQSVVDMGYLPRVVKKALDILIPTHGLQDLTGQLIANLVIDMESKGEKVMKPALQATRSVHDGSKLSLEDKRKLAEENREYKEKIACVICCEAERAITFLPCGHLVCCAQCAPACSTCAVCRKDIKGTVKVSLR